MLNLIVAISKNNAIGINNDLPWNLPGDLAHFAKTTRDSVVIMGYNTWASLDFSPLPKRVNIVITTKPHKSTKDVKFIKSISEAVDLAKSYKKEIFVIGGASIYSYFLDIVDRMYITEVNTVISGADTFFPKIKYENFKLVSKENGPKDSSISYSFLVYERK